ncbi:MAG: hypothetical protein CK424_00190 [Legionella sp.]|nr:MAG: hypothetical protein CK424_00190 [Legionella sp.]
MPNEKKQLEAIKNAALEKAKQSPNTGMDAYVVPGVEDEGHTLIQAYKEAFGGKAGYKEPVNQEGHIAFSFPQKGDAEQFFMSQAQKGIKMTIATNTCEVVGYSSEDGHLYHPDGEEFQQGDGFKSSEITLDNFVLPSAARP